MSFAESDRLTATRRRLAQLRWWLLGGLAFAVLAAPTFLIKELKGRFNLA